MKYLLTFMLLCLLAVQPAQTEPKPELRYEVKRALGCNEPEQTMSYLDTWNGFEDVYVRRLARAIVNIEAGGVICNSHDWLVVRWEPYPTQKTRYKAGDNWRIVKLTVVGVRMGEVEKLFEPLVPVILYGAYESEIPLKALSIDLL